MIFGKWVACSELMPERDCLYGDKRGSEPVFVTYLSYYDRKTPCVACRTAIYAGDGKWFWGDDEDGMQTECVVKITAWMPLPVAYKGG